MKWNNRKIKPTHLFVLFGILSIWLLHTDGDKLGGDGHDYFMYCRNLFFYGDLQFHAQDKDIPNERFQQNMKSGVLKTPFSIGPALAWLPFYAVAHGVTCIESVWHKKEIDGFERNYKEIIGWGTVVYVFIGLYLLFLLLLKFEMTSRISLLCVSLGFFGTFLINYTIFESSMAHGISFFTVSLYLFLWYQFKSDLNLKRCFLLGLVLGLSMLMRYTNFIFAFFPVMAMLENFNWKKIFHFSVFAAAAFSVFSIQMLTWKVCFGKYALIPQGESFMIWAQPKIFAVLFSYKHGLFSSHWLIPIGLIGFVYLARTHKFGLLSFFLIFFSLVYVNATARDWYAGHSFGNRRFDSLLPFVIIGLSVPLNFVESLISRKKRTVLFFILAPFVLYNLFYLHFYRRNIDKRDQVITPIDILDHAYKKTRSLVHSPPA